MSTVPLVTLHLLSIDDLRTLFEAEKIIMYDNRGRVIDIDDKILDFFQLITIPKDKIPKNESYIEELYHFDEFDTKKFNFTEQEELDRLLENIESDMKTYDIMVNQLKQIKFSGIHFRVSPCIDLLKNLEVVEFKNCSFKKTKPPRGLDFIRIKKLTLDSCNLHDFIDLHDTTITELNLQNNFITEINPNKLPLFPRFVKSVNLTNNQIKKVDLDIQLTGKFKIAIDLTDNPHIQELKYNQKFFQINGVNQDIRNMAQHGNTPDEPLPPRRKGLWGTVKDRLKALTMRRKKSGGKTRRNQRK